MDARVSELFQSVGGSKTELLPSDRMCKACFQSVGKLLKVESSASSILNTLKANIRALALTQAISSTQSGQRGKRVNTSEHSNPSPKRPVLYPSRWNAFQMATSMLLLVLAISLVFITPLNEHTLANPYFRIHAANIGLHHRDYLFYDLIGTGKIPAEYKECVLNQPDCFSARYTASDAHTGLKVWEQD